MSGFGDSSPFGDPFSDPSITQATRQNANEPLEDYNPFANRTSSAGPAVLETTRPAVQNGSNTVQATPVSSSAQLTQEDLIKKHAELEKRAAELAAREEALRSGQVDVRQPNFPPIPSFCPFGPCLYQDINVEIPVEFQRIVRYAYYLWMYFILVSLANLIAGVVLTIVEKSFETLSYGIFATVFISPLSFLFWFRPLYKAFKTDSSFNFMIFFFVFFCQIVYSILTCLGISGALGIFSVIGALSAKKVGLTLLSFLVCAMEISYSALSILLLLRVHNIYKSTGASFDKAKAEFASGVMSNETVQQSVAGATRNAVSSAISSTLSGGSASTGGVRY